MKNGVLGMQGDGQCAIGKMGNCRGPSKGVCSNYQTNKHEARSWVRFVTLAEPNMASKMRVRWCGFTLEWEALRNVMIFA